MNKLFAGITLTMALALSSYATVLGPLHTPVVTPKSTAINHTVIPAALPAVQTACIYGQGNACKGEGPIMRPRVKATETACLYGSGACPGEDPHEGYIVAPHVLVSQSTWPDFGAF